MSSTALAPMPPLIDASGPERPKWAYARFAKALEDERRRTGEGRTEFLQRIALASGTTVASLYVWMKKGSDGPADFLQGVHIAKLVGKPPEYFTG